MIIKLRHWRHGAYPLCNNQVALIYNIPLSFQRISLTDASLAMKSARSSMIIMIRLNYNPLSKQRWETLMLTRASIARYPTQAKKIDLQKIPRVAVGPAWGVFAKVNVPRRPHWTGRYSWRKSTRPVAYQFTAAVADKWHLNVRRNSLKDSSDTENKSTMTCRERKRIGFQRILAMHLSSQKTWKPSKSLSNRVER